MAGPDYHLLTTIAVPTDAVNVQPGGAFTAFDISFFDPTTGNDYVADRSNASVDIFSGTSNTFLGRATGFTGQQSSTSTSGADGVVTVTSGGKTTLYAGDGNLGGLLMPPTGNSFLRIFDATNPASPTLLQSVNSGGTFRVDEMAYSPLTHQVLAANNADAPAFANLYQTTLGTTPVSIGHGPLSVSGAAPSDGMEQPVWDPKTGTFFVSIPAFNGDQGGVQEINTDGTLGRRFQFATMTNGPASCSPTGLALGASGNLMVGCSPSSGFAQAVLLNPAGNGGAGSIVKLFTQISGTDEIWYDPKTGDFYVTGHDASGDHVFDVISDATESLLQSIDLTALGANVNAHSIAVDEANGDVFVPLEGTTSAGTNTLCPLGCVAVFGVPEPGSLPLLVVGLAGLMGLAVRRRLQQ
jgi:hypothetical protein